MAVLTARVCLDDDWQGDEYLQSPHYDVSNPNAGI